jgi:zinc protease
MNTQMNKSANKIINKLLWSITLLTTVLWAKESTSMEIQHATLPNGMNIIVVPDHRAPVVIHSVWYGVGSIDEKQGKTGLSHMLEHLMFKGTDKFPNRALDFAVVRNGGVQNAFTSRDMTAYHQTISVDKLPILMEMEADRMENLNITEEDFGPEISVVAEERKLHVKSTPTNAFFERLLKAHYQQHPYGNPVIGWTNDIAAYTTTRPTTLR